MPVQTGISVRKLDWRDWPGFAPTWEHVHDRCPEASFFVSRVWVDCWLAIYGPELNPELIALVDDGEVVGCCLLVWRTQWVNGIPLRRVYLNCAGENDADSTCIEFNCLPVLPEHEERAAEALITYLRSRGWDELMLSGVVEQKALQLVAEALGKSEVDEVITRYVDFSTLRNPPVDFLSSLSSKTRYHIRRTQRAFEEAGGPCTLSVSHGQEETLAMLRQLVELHQARWKGRGHAGAFGSAKFSGFHEMVIRQATDQTVLFRVQAGAEVVGLIYCFLFRGWLYYYQSGFSFSLDSRRSPGLLTLQTIISHCLKQPDILGFDFMAGDQEYKRSLVATYRPLRWIVVRRPTAPALLYLGLRQAKRTLAGIARKTQTGVTTGGADPASEAGAGTSGESAGPAAK